MVETGRVLINTHDLANSGVIDLAGGGLIVNGASSQTVQYQAWIKGGYNNGQWNGTTNSINKVVTNGAINSSLAHPNSNPTDFAVGYAPASAIYGTFPANFLGQSVASTAMLVRYTTIGDANLDGKANALDFNALASNFGSTTANWFQGDYNYDGKVNSSDFSMLADHFNSSAPSSAPPMESLPPTAPPAVPQENLFSTTAIHPMPEQDMLSSTVVGWRNGLKSSGVLWEM